MLERMCPPTRNSRCFVGPCSHNAGDLSKKVLGEPSDVGVETILAGDHVTTSSSFTVLRKGETERLGGCLHELINC